MGIIESILNEWLKCEKSIADEWRACKNESESIKQRITQLDNETSSIYSNYDSNKRKFKDVYDFMDYIGVGHEKLQIPFEEVDQELIDKNNAQKKKLCDMAADISDKQHMFLTYYNLIQAMKTGNKSDAELFDMRSKQRLFIPEYELFVDVFILNKIAKAKMNLANKLSYQSKDYIDAIDIFNTENVFRYGHHKQVDVDEGKQLDLIMAICRVSLEKQFISCLSDKMEEVARNRKMRQAIIKSEKNNRIFRYWKRDTTIIDYSDIHASVFTDAYKNDIADSEKKDINYFIKSF